MPNTESIWPTWSDVASSVIAAFMVPGVALFVPGDFLKTAAEDPYGLLGLVSLSLIAASIGKPFIDFVYAEAFWWMERRRQEHALQQAEQQSKPKRRF